jgi:hypothetical protein
MLRHRISQLATVAAVASIALTATTGVAAAGTSGGHGHPRPAKVVKKHRSSSIARHAPGGSRVPVVSTPTSVAISAFPTGDKGSGSEATCGLWSDRLQQDVEVLGEAESVDDRVAASNDLQQDKNDALDAGCVVID